MCATGSEGSFKPATDNLKTNLTRTVSKTVQDKIAPNVRVLEAESRGPVSSPDDIAKLVCKHVAFDAVVKPIYRLAFREAFQGLAFIF